MWQSDPEPLPEPSSATPTPWPQGTTMTTTWCVAPPNTKHDLHVEPHGRGIQTNSCRLPPARPQDFDAIDAAVAQHLAGQTSGQATCHAPPGPPYGGFGPGGGEGARGNNSYGSGGAGPGLYQHAFSGGGPPAAAAVGAVGHAAHSFAIGPGNQQPQHEQPGRDPCRSAAAWPPAHGPAQHAVAAAGGAVPVPQHHQQPWRLHPEPACSGYPGTATAGAMAPVAAAAPVALAGPPSQPQGWGPRAPPAQGPHPWGQPQAAHPHGLASTALSIKNNWSRSKPSHVSCEGAAAAAASAAAAAVPTYAAQAIALHPAAAGPHVAPQQRQPPLVPDGQALLLPPPHRQAVTHASAGSRSSGDSLNSSGHSTAVPAQAPCLMPPPCHGQLQPAAWQADPVPNAATGQAPAHAPARHPQQTCSLQLGAAQLPSHAPQQAAHHGLHPQRLPLQPLQLQQPPPPPPQGQVAQPAAAPATAPQSAAATAGNKWDAILQVGGDGCVTLRPRGRHGHQAPPITPIHPVLLLLGAFSGTSHDRFEAVLGCPCHMACDTYRHAPPVTRQYVLHCAAFQGSTWTGAPHSSSTGGRLSGGAPGAQPAGRTSGHEALAQAAGPACEAQRRPSGQQHIASVGFNMDVQGAATLAASSLPQPHGHPPNQQQLRTSEGEDAPIQACVAGQPHTARTAGQQMHGLLLQPHTAGGGVEPAAAHPHDDPISDDDGWPSQPQLQAQVLPDVPTAQQHLPLCVVPDNRAVALGTRPPAGLQEGMAGRMGAGAAPALSRAPYVPLDMSCVAVEVEDPVLVRGEGGACRSMDACLEAVVRQQHEHLKVPEVQASTAVAEHRCLILVPAACTTLAHRCHACRWPRSWRVRTCSSRSPSLESSCRAGRRRPLVNLPGRHQPGAPRLWPALEPRMGRWCTSQTPGAVVHSHSCAFGARSVGATRCRSILAGCVHGSCTHWVVTMSQLQQ